MFKEFLKNLLRILIKTKMNKYEFIEKVNKMAENCTITIINDDILNIHYKTKKSFDITIKKELSNDLDFIKELIYLKEILQDLKIIK